MSVTRRLPLSKPVSESVEDLIPSGQVPVKRGDPGLGTLDTVFKILMEMELWKKRTY